MSKPQAYVGSDTCKMCHLEHYDSWQMTLHSRTGQDLRINADAIVVPLDEKKIREDLAEFGEAMTVPADKVWIPRVEDIRYTIGSQWKQQYIVERDGTLYVAPIQYNVGTHRWVPYHAEDWQERPWFLYCGGCHVTGLDLEKGTFTELSIGCEACHGKGSWHAALPKTAVFEKRKTIINPAKLTMGVAVQICGSCHNRGESTQHEAARWPVGFAPGKALEVYFKSKTFDESDEKYVYSKPFLAEGHHQQYIDWRHSQHYKEGVTCTSCHFVHQIGIPPTRSQTFAAGSKQCFECHIMINKVQAHNIHSFANCIGCHMPRIIKSAESGDIHSHVFVTLLPIDTLRNPDVPNSCQACHKHEGADLRKLQQAFDPTGDIGGEMDLPGEAGGSDWGEFGN